MDIIKTIQWKDDRVIILDQRLLPRQEVYQTYEDYLGIAQAIKNMVIRGAPAIGVAAAMGVALGALGIGVKTFEDFYERIVAICHRLASTRPTAVNLTWALERMKACTLSNSHLPLNELAKRLKQEALTIYQEDLESGFLIGRHGQGFLEDGYTVLTHCNAGGLATAGYGTALGIIYSAQNAGKRIAVIADETRPLLQGARLTAWELQKWGIKVTVITDGMSGTLMRQGKINVVLVGADRIAANGDVANKIGTYTLAVLAQKHQIPFYVAAPVSTIDLKITDGSKILIEERNPDEVRRIGNQEITPQFVDIYNPAFDVTPADLVSAIITDRGVAKPPYLENLLQLF